MKYFTIRNKQLFNDESTFEIKFIDEQDAIEWDTDEFRYKYKNTIIENENYKAIKAINIATQKYIYFIYYPELKIIKFFKNSFSFYEFMFDVYYEDIWHIEDELFTTKAEKDQFYILKKLIS